MHIWINKKQCQFEIGHQRRSIPGKRCSQKTFDYLFNYLHDPISSEYVPSPAAEGDAYKKPHSAFHPSRKSYIVGQLPSWGLWGTWKMHQREEKKEKGEMRKWKDAGNYPLILFVNTVLPFSSHTTLQFCTEVCSWFASEGCRAGPKGYVV